MSLRAGIAMPRICPVSLQAGGTVALTLVTICTMWFVAGVAFAYGGPVSWPTGLAIGGISGAADAVGVSTAKGKTGQQKKRNQLEHSYNYHQDITSAIHHYSFDYCFFTLKMTAFPKGLA